MYRKSILHLVRLEAQIVLLFSITQLAADRVDYYVFMTLLEFLSLVISLTLLQAAQLATLFHRNGQEAAYIRIPGLIPARACK